MKFFAKSALVAGLTMSAFAAPMATTPAVAQVNGIATSNPAMVIAMSQARSTAYQQINQTYAANIQQIRQLETELQPLRQQIQALDTNQDGQLTPQERQANPALIQQVQQKEQQINTNTQPIALAQYFVIDQLIKDYDNARNQVISSKSISLMLSPDAIQYAPDSVDVTGDIVTALNTRLPTVSTAVPAGWQPTRASAQMQQAVEQILILAARAQQAQQQPAATPAPSGR